MKSKLTALACATGLAFLLLTILVATGNTAIFDFAVRTWALSLNSPNLVTFWKSLTLLGSVAVLTSMTAISLGLLIFNHHRPAATLLSIAMAGSVAFDNSIKWLVHRPRPDEFYADTLPTSFSYPSGHALYNLVFYFTSAYILSRDIIPVWRRELWIVAIILAILIGASRIFLGVHYFSDVLGGYLVGITWLILAVFISGKVARRLS